MVTELVCRLRNLRPKQVDTVAPQATFKSPCDTPAAADHKTLASSTQHGSDMTSSTDVLSGFQLQQYQPEPGLHHPLRRLRPSANA